MMELLVGTSGFSYKAWKGSFYPERQSERTFLDYYATRLPTVEINNTFYRSPRPELLSGWAGKVGPGFVFVLKAPQRITHRARLAGARAQVQELWDASESLGPHRGPFLFQLPPSFRRDLERLERFLDELPEGLQAAFEFRHPTWSDDAVHALLQAHGAALCLADVDGAERPAIVPTASFGYLRLRRTAYEEKDLAAIARELAQQSWTRAFVFFKHEDAGAAPRFALDLRERFQALQ